MAEETITPYCLYLSIELGSQKGSLYTLRYDNLRFHLRLMFFRNYIQAKKMIQCSSVTADSHKACRSLTAPMPCR